MIITKFVTPLLQSNMYLLSENDHGLIIDPYEDPAFCAQIREQVKEIDYILLTHEHCDHISGADIFRTQFHSPVLCGEICGERIQNASDNFSHYFNAYVSLQTEEMVPEEYLFKEDVKTFADETFSGRRNLCWQGHCLELRETPGHSPGSTCILLDGTSLFSGDNLLPGDKVMLRFPGGSRRQYEETALRYFRALSPDTIVYPGHYAPFRLGDHPAIKGK